METDDPPVPAPPDAPAPAPGRIQRSRAAAERQLRRGERLVSRWEGELPLVAAALGAWRSDARIGGGLVAGGLAFRLFTFLLPVLLLLYTVVEVAPEGSSGEAGRVTHDVGLGALALDSVASAAADETGGRYALLAAALFAVLLTGSSLVRSLVLAHRIAWALPPAKTRSSALAVGLAFVTVLGLLATNLVAAKLHALPVFGRLAAEVVAFAVYAAVWLGISWLLPHGDVPPRALLPGALVVAAGGVGLHVITAWYLVGRADRAAELYGPLGVATVLLLWLFILGRLVVASALLNASLSRQITPAG
jgi:uncharacterized BrkB/YihY/UPF0761 family membrane protein